MEAKECNCPRDSSGKRIGGSSNCPVHVLAPGGGAGGPAKFTPTVPDGEVK